MGAGDFETKDSGERAQFDSGMQRDLEDGKPRFDLMIPLGVPYDEQMITRLAALYGRGAVKYKDRNWEKANSEAELARFKSSAYRHFMQWFMGEIDEDHAAAVMFNIIGHETTAHKVAQGPKPIQFVETVEMPMPPPFDDEVEEPLAPSFDVEGLEPDSECDFEVPYMSCPVACQPSAHRYHDSVDKRASENHRA